MLLNPPKVHLSFRGLSTLMVVFIGPFPAGWKEGRHGMHPDGRNGSLTGSRLMSLKLRRSSQALNIAMGDFHCSSVDPVLTLLPGYWIIRTNRYGRINWEAKGTCIFFGQGPLDTSYILYSPTTPTLPLALRRARPP